MQDVVAAVGGGGPSGVVEQVGAHVLGAVVGGGGTAYLMGLAAPQRRRARRPRRENVPSGTAKLLRALPLPAFVEGRYLDVLAANPLAGALSPRLVTGGNRLRDVFLDPAEQAMFPDWERAAAALVAGFRDSVGTDTGDPRCIELVGELSLASPFSGGCGRATTCAPGPVRSSRSSIRRSANWSSIGRNYWSAGPTG
nr:hypothetical protein Ade03nite_94220 [Actinoplanes derwentensis]